jgi:phosphomethylpyrimidine synthase
MRKYDVSFSLSGSLRPGSIADANDRAQFAELETLSELTKVAWDKGCQVMIGAGPCRCTRSGHMEKHRECGEVPSYTRPADHRHRSSYDHVIGDRRGDDDPEFGTAAYVTPKGISVA